MCRSFVTSYEQHIVVLDGGLWAEGVSVKQGRPSLRFGIRIFCSLRGSSAGTEAQAGYYLI